MPIEVARRMKTAQSKKKPGLADRVDWIGLLLRGRYLNKIVADAYRFALIDLLEHTNPLVILDQKLRWRGPRELHPVGMVLELSSSAVVRITDKDITCSIA